MNNDFPEDIHRKYQITMIYYIIIRIKNYVKNQYIKNT